jgi:antibiotic biosynthesis monooxygenase (ABM) superfamily enzyme
MQPRKWKMWLIIWLAAYPIVLILSLAASFLLKDFPMYIRSAVITFLMVGAMVHLVIPLAMRLFGDWLRK